MHCAGPALVRLDTGALNHSYTDRTGTAWEADRSYQGAHIRPVSSCPVLVLFPEHRSCTSDSKSPCSTSLSPGSSTVLHTAFLETL